MASRILLTGFEPFHSSKRNPSKEVVKRIEHPALVAKEVLPVVFGESARRLIELINKHAPDVVICLGQAEGRTQITPERVAINLDDARIADNAGNWPKESPIVADGPAAYFTTLPVTRIVNSLSEAGFPAAISLSAGTFVCNHIFYTMQRHCASKGIKSGFIHLPLMNEQSEEFPGFFTMDLNEMVRGMNLVLDDVS